SPSRRRAAADACPIQRKERSDGNEHGQAWQGTRGYDRHQHDAADRRDAGAARDADHHDPDPAPFGQPQHARTPSAAAPQPARRAQTGVEPPMDYARQQRDPARHAVGIVFVVAVHAFVIYALMTGLARQALHLVKKPLDVAVIEEVKLPPPPPPPKKIEPPKAPPPPPAFVPPPDVPTTAVSSESAITQVTQAAPVAPPPPVPVVVAPPPPPKPAIRR